MGVELLGYKIYKDTKESFIKYIDSVAQKIHIVSGNPEVLYNGLNNADLRNNFISDRSIIIPDGIGTIIACKIIKKPVREKIAGIEIMEAILELSIKKNKGVYFLGAKQEILEKCIENLKSRYSGLMISGYHHGYFDLNNCDDIIKDIAEKKPYALLVAMGSPKQELFITKYMDILPVNVFMGVGGSFDVFAGKVKRAPKWMINIGMEWLYRVAKEPWRIKRLTSIPKFLLKVIYSVYIIKK